MKHFQGTRFVGDIVSPVQLQDVNGKTVARCQVGIIEENNRNGQQQRFMHKHFIEVWGPAAKFLASIPQGNTIMGEGKFVKYKYKGQNGQDQWADKITVFTFGNCGPSQYQQQNQQQGQQQYGGGGYQQQPPQQQQQTGYPPQGGYGAAPNSYPPHGVNQNYPPQGVNQAPPPQQNQQQGAINQNPQGYPQDEGGPVPF